MHTYCKMAVAPKQRNTNAYKTNKPASPVIVAKADVDLLLKGKKDSGFQQLVHFKHATRYTGFPDDEDQKEIGFSNHLKIDN